MEIMVKKLLTILLIVFIAVLISSCFDILHDQITYTISPEYYTTFKFSQFGLLPYVTQNNMRTMVSITGVIATWWVGFILGLIFALLSLRLIVPKKMILASIKAMVLAICYTVVLAVAGYIYSGIILIHSDNFIIVGSIHTASYIGALIGLIAGSRYILKRKTLAI
jgi:hypothetical protein